MATALSLPDNAVWFVTGVSSGIGHSLITSILETPGHRLVGTSRNISSVTLPLTSNDSNTLLQPMDLRSESSIDAAIEAAVAKFGRIDVVVNNAGYSTFCEIESLPIASAKDLMSVNYWACVQITRSAMRIMREVNPTTGPIGGVIAQISSIGAIISSPGVGFYQSTKWALEAFTEVAGKEVDPEWQIRFVIFEPGSTKTKWYEENMQHFPQHPAYVGKNLATDQTATMFRNHSGSDPDAVAGLMVRTVLDKEGKWGGRSTLRLPTGADAWALAVRNSKDRVEVLEKWKVESQSVSTAESLQVLKDYGLL